MQSWKPSYSSTLDRVCPLEIEKESTGEDGATGGAIIVDAAAAGGQRCVDLAKRAWTLHDLPSFMSCIWKDGQRIQALRKVGVQDAESGRFLIGDGDLRQVTAVGAAVTTTHVWISAVLGKPLTGQGTAAQLY